ncbi:unnamed protein product [Cyprideis torosa]|uniref:Uncharacterized protein n=1 Tax=Cyprideis torosa TaxID=163714 RepID=A0A7R8W1G9_9CRUS|nr:unnamed protein product [Cyprideis torosa]CAG0880895.1 unnamed protein product [Cyprideis torosa]
MFYCPKVYFQRVLACKTPRLAQIMSFAAAAGAIIMVIPSALFGIVGKATSRNASSSISFAPEWLQCCFDDREETSLPKAWPIQMPKSDISISLLPRKVYFQRVLSSKTAGRAQILSYVAAIGCIVMAIPSVIVGVVAKSASG